MIFINLSVLSAQTLCKRGRCYGAFAFALSRIYLYLTTPGFGWWLRGITGRSYCVFELRWNESRLKVEGLIVCSANTNTSTFSSNREFHSSPKQPIRNVISSSSGQYYRLLRCYLVGFKSCER